MSTKIEWATETWNPITGCSKISEGCQNCYAERMAKRLAGRYGYPKDKPFSVTFHEERLMEPLGWRKPRMVFVCSMGDLFHEDVEDGPMTDVFNSMWDDRNAHHTFLLLTKRPERMKWVFNQIEKNGGPMNCPNIWVGVTAENRCRIEERIPVLLQIPAAVRFVSVEPMLGPVDFGRIYIEPGSEKLDWVICGGESGPGARPMHPDWVRSLRDQCAFASPFFFKSWGDHGEYYQQPGSACPKWSPDAKALNKKPYEYVTIDGHRDKVARYGSSKMVKVGKKQAGRLLDGKEWNEYPSYPAEDQLK